MNKKEFSRELAKRHGYLIKDTNAIVSNMLDLLIELISDGESVSFLNFGTFEPYSYKSKMVKNVNDGKMMQAKGYHSIRLRASDNVKEFLTNPSQEKFKEEE